MSLSLHISISMSLSLYVSLSPSACVCPDGAGGVVQLLRVQDPGLRGRVALQGLQLWPLDGCLDLLEFCLNEPHLPPALRKDLELRKSELDVYHLVCTHVYVPFMLLWIKASVILRKYIVY